MTKIDQLGQGLATTKPAAQDRRARGLSMCSPMFPHFLLAKSGCPGLNPRNPKKFRFGRTRQRNWLCWNCEAGSWHVMALATYRLNCHHTTSLNQQWTSRMRRLGNSCAKGNTDIHRSFGCFPVHVPFGDFRCLVDICGGHPYSSIQKELTPP